MPTMTSLFRSSSCKYLAFGLLALTLTAGSATAQETAAKIAVVNLDYIVTQSPAGKALQGQLEAFQAQVQSEAEALNNEAKELRQRLVDGANSLSEDKLTEMQKQLEDKTIAIRRFRDDKQRQGQKMQEEGLREVEKQLEPVFTAIRDEGGYDLILNNVPGVVVMVSQRVDITQKVLDKLKASSGS